MARRPTGKTGSTRERSARGTESRLRGREVEATALCRPPPRRMSVMDDAPGRAGGNRSSGLQRYQNGARWFAEQSLPDTAFRSVPAPLCRRNAGSAPATTDSLADHRDALVRSLLQSILFGMNWADYAGNNVQLEQLLRSAYGYNFWGDPAALEL